VGYGNKSRTPYLYLIPDTPKKSFLSVETFILKKSKRAFGPLLIYNGWTKIDEMLKSFSKE
jgi:hypothetical protein